MLQNKSQQIGNFYFVGEKLDQCLLLMDTWNNLSGFHSRLNGTNHRLPCQTHKVQTTKGEIVLWSFYEFYPISNESYQKCIQFTECKNTKANMAKSVFCDSKKRKPGAQDQFNCNEMPEYNFRYNVCSNILRVIYSKSELQTEL